MNYLFSDILYNFNLCLYYCMDNIICHIFNIINSLLPRPRRGLRGIVFTRSVCLSVCVSVCLSVCVSGQYFGILFLSY